MTPASALLVAPTARNAGSERALLGLARTLQSRGAEIEVLLFEPGPLVDWLAGEGIPTHVTALTTLRAPAAYLRAVGKAWSVARRLRAEVIVSNLPQGHAVGGAAGRLLRTPAVMWQHGQSGTSAIERAVDRLPTVFVGCVGPHGVARHRATRSRHRADRWDPGVPVRQVRERAGCGADVRATLPKDALLVGIVGRLQPWKGQETFLRAAALVASEQPGACFVVVGGALDPRDADYARGLEQLALDLGIAHRVTFTGHQADPLPWMDALDVVVHASDDEPYGLVVVEAMALGKAIVAAATGGPAELCVHGETALLSTPGDVVGYARAVSTLLEDPGMRSKMGAAAQARAVTLDETASTDRFEELLARCSAPGPWKAAP